MMLSAASAQRKGDNSSFGFVLMPSPNCSLRPNAPGAENMHRHGEGMLSHDDVNPAIPALVFWNLVDKRYWITRHSLPLLLNTAEQGGKNNGNAESVNRPSSLTGALTGRYRPIVSGKRRSDCQLSQGGAA